MLTIKRAKATRCAEPSALTPGQSERFKNRCETWHRTCRRCEHHGTWGFNTKSKMCNECHAEYRDWYVEHITSPAVAAYDAEKEAGLAPDWSPFALTECYTYWMEQAPYKCRAVYTIQGEVLNLEDG